MRMLQYPYETHSGKMLLGGVFSSIGAVVLFYMAKTNNRGLILNHLVEFSPGQATIFYLVLAGLAGLGAVLGLLAFIGNQGGPKQLTLTETRLTVPSIIFGGSQKVVKVSDIQWLSLVAFKGYRYLYVRHSSGKIRINEECFPSNAAFAELYHALAYLTQPRAA